MGCGVHCHTVHGNHAIFREEQRRGFGRLRWVHSLRVSHGNFEALGGHVVWLWILGCVQVRVTTWQIFRERTSR